ncbi:hypothetical protein BLNAU_5767 [Blattamonas nauphoetae]|uniref:Uncharacterized protein n=1 Tax=Blattamonas nauphoetae TaxID=2049346 RepID=A0ABQ9Y676_9EUKA|nr:hypothetical protein BLNAU_5767 [Blattamonas nauphoetae]
MMSGPLLSIDSIESSELRGMLMRSAFELLRDVCQMSSYLDDDDEGEEKFSESQKELLDSVVNILTIHSLTDPQPVLPMFKKLAEIALDANPPPSLDVKVLKNLLIQGFVFSCQLRRFPEECSVLNPHICSHLVENRNNISDLSSYSTLLFETAEFNLHPVQEIIPVLATHIKEKPNTLMYLSTLINKLLTLLPDSTAQFLPTLLAIFEGSDDTLVTLAMMCLSTVAKSTSATELIPTIKKIKANPTKYSTSQSFGMILTMVSDVCSTPERVALGIATFFSIQANLDPSSMFYVIPICNVRTLYAIPDIDLTILDPHIPFIQELMKTTSNGTISSVAKLLLETRNNLSLTSVNQSVEKVSSDVEETKVQTTQVEQSVTVAKERINNVHEDVKSTHARVDSMEATVDGMGSDVDAAKRQAKEALEIAKEAKRMVETVVSTLEDSLARHEEQIRKIMELIEKHGLSQ